MADAFDLLTEARWEQEGIRRAAQRYREAAASRNPAELPSGQRLLREVIPPLTERITALQLRGADLIASGARVVKWAWPIQLLDAETLSVITVIQSLNAERGEVEASAIAIALGVAAAVRDEVDYREWLEEQAKANKAAREAQDWTHRDLIAAFKVRYPNVSRDTWKMWRRKLRRIKADPWPKDMAVQLGAALLHALVEAAPQRFSLEAVPVAGGRRQNLLKLSPETLAMMRDIEARAEVARPRLMPMLITPLPWRYE